MKTIGERLKFLRKKRNLTSEQLAEAIGLKKGSISSYENDRYEPSAKTIISICNYFNISSDWLLTGEGKAFKQPEESDAPFAKGFELSQQLDDIEVPDPFADIEPNFEERYLIHLFRSLKANQQAFVQGLMHGMIHIEELKEEDIFNEGNDEQAASKELA